MNDDVRPHPYLPHTADGAARAMLDHIGVGEVSDLFADIPAHLRQRSPFGLPAPLRSEVQLVRHVRQRLARNTTTLTATSFCGAGTYQHHVPAVCREVANRAEFVSAYAGEPYEDHGKHQALFEYQSLMAELLEMDVVGIPTYDGYQAAGTALRMAGRITGRPHAVTYGRLLADRRSRLEEYVHPTLARLEHLAGHSNLAVLEQRLGEDCAAVLVELPDAHGLIDADIATIAELAHRAGAILIVAIDPITLGLLAPNARHGADIVCGDLQTLGNGMHFGGAHAGFVAVHDDPRFVYELPTRLYGLAPTRTEGEIGFIDIAYERTSLAAREHGVEWIGTASALSGIVAATFLSLHGPQGMRELGDAIFDRTSYALAGLSGVPGCSVLDADRPHFREFVLRLDGENRTAHDLLENLARQHILGGVAVAVREVLVSVTEIHERDDIDRLITAVKDYA